MFCLNKKTIIINMDSIDSWCREEIKNMLFYSLSGVDDVDNKSNLNILRLKILNMFTNLKTIIIYSTDTGGEKAYPFSLFVLIELLSKLESVKNGNNIKCVITGVWKDYHNNKDGKRSWLFYQYSSIESDLFSSSLNSYKTDKSYNDVLTIESLK